MLLEFSLGACFSFLISLLIVGGLIFQRYQRGPQRSYNVDLSGQIVIITGCSAGIGKESAREIAKFKATVIFACRDEQKTAKIISQIKAQTNNSNLVFMKLDLQDYNQIKEFSAAFHKKYTRLNILVNNAGVGFPSVTSDKDGHDLNFKTNHMGHFLLTNLLMDLIVSTKQSRIINVSSQAHIVVRNPVNFNEAYNGKITKPFLSYSTSKYANVLFTNQLQKIFDEKKIDSKAVSLHPGFVSTDIVLTHIPNKLNRILLKPLTKLIYSVSLNETQGSWTTNYTALQPYEQLKPAGYYEKNSLSQYSQYIKKFDQAQELWRFSEKELNIKSII